MLSAVLMNVSNQPSLAKCTSELVLHLLFEVSKAVSVILVPCLYKMPSHDADSSKVYRVTRIDKNLVTSV